MANRIKPKRSLTGAKVPDNLEQHELAINVPDKRVYIGGVAGAAILIGDYNHAPNPVDQELNKASSATFSTVTTGAITLINTKGNSGQYFTSNGDGTTKWSTPSAGAKLVADTGNFYLTNSGASSYNQFSDSYTESNILTFSKPSTTNAIGWAVAAAPESDAFVIRTHHSFSIYNSDFIFRPTWNANTNKSSGTITFPDNPVQSTAFT